jgi:hypothetical protein
VRTGHGFNVSIRAPAQRPDGADALARNFPSGSGRRGAAGITGLAEGDLQRFAALFERSFREPD